MPARVSCHAPRIVTTNTGTALCAELALFVKLGLDLGVLAHSSGAQQFDHATRNISSSMSRDGRWNLISADFTARKDLAAPQLEGAARRGYC